MEHLLERRGAADLADLRVRIGHPMEHLEQVSLRAAEFVDRHGKIKASRAIRRLPSRAYGSALDGRDGHDPAGARRRGSPLPRRDAGELDRRLFVGGVAAITAAVAVFLLRPARQAGRRTRTRRCRSSSAGTPLGGLFDIVLGKRGGAPLHFLLAWIVAHTRRRAPRDAPALRALRGREHPGDRDPRQPARRARARARRDRARGGELGAALPRDLRADVQPLPVPLDALVPRPPPRAEAGRRARLGALGPDDAADDRRAPVRRARPRLAGALRPGHPASAGARRSPPSRPSVILAIPLWRASLVLADRYDVGVGGERRRPLARRTRSSRISGTSPATRRPATRACSSSYLVLAARRASHSSPAPTAAARSSSPASS